MKSLAMALLLTLLCCGCVANRVYRPGASSVVAIPHAPAANGCDPRTQHTCLAFLEFDDMGEMWEPEQLDRAAQLIRDATAANPQHHAVVLAFVHGWKNNAEERRDKTGNVFGFEQVLSQIDRSYPDVPIVGIYLGWRGDVVSKYWPVQRQTSYFNREETAIRIPGASMTNALTRIMAESHRPDAEATLILVGHSFGGLVLERALTQATVDRIRRDASGEAPANANAGVRADTVIFLNSAAAASEAKQMLDLLKKEDLHYREPGSDTEAPLFVSISSLGDAATRFAMPVGHGVPFLRYKAKGSLRDNDPLYHSPQKTSQGDFYMSTAAHMQILQSHQVLKVADTPPGAKIWASFELPDTHDRYNIVEKPGRWNDTPYWMMEVPADIIPDHSTIFTGRCIQLLYAFLPKQSRVTDPTLRPRLSK